MPESTEIDAMMGNRGYKSLSFPNTLLRSTCKISKYILCKNHARLPLAWTKHIGIQLELTLSKVNVLK